MKVIDCFGLVRHNFIFHASMRRKSPLKSYNSTFLCILPSRNNFPLASEKRWGCISSVSLTLHWNGIKCSSIPPEKKRLK